MVFHLPEAGYATCSPGDRASNLATGFVASTGQAALDFPLCLLGAGTPLCYADGRLTLTPR